MAQVGIDGVKGAEWTGISATQVTYDAGADTSNFGTPSALTVGPSYDIYIRSDANYLYGLVVATDNFDKTVSNFSNVYFNVDNNRVGGSTFGLEIGGGNDAFVPGGAGGFSVAGYLFNAGFLDTAGGNVTQEFALSWNYLTNDPMGMGFDKTVAGDKVTLRLSQTFNYSVAGGTSYGADRLGSTTYINSVPGPSALAGFGLGLLGRVRRRRSSK